MQSGSGLPALSSGERFLLWLAEAPEAAGPATQAAVAAALGVSRSQASRTGAALVAAGFAVERPARVPGFGRAVTVYGLSEQGRAEAARVRALVGQASVPVRRAGAEGRLPLAEALQAAGIGLWDALAALRSQGHLDAGAGPAAGAVPAVPAVPAAALRGFRAELREAPPPRPFVGRARAPEDVARWAASRVPILATEGAAGGGKSSLAAHVVRTAGLRLHVLWVQVLPSLGAEQFLHRIDSFLRSLGRAGPPLPADDEGTLFLRLRERVGRLPVLIVLDDVQKASPPVQGALAVLGRAASASGHPRLWLVGREVALPHDLVPEAKRMVLEPLADAEADAMLEGLGVAAAQRPALVRRCKGNPLFLALAARNPAAPQRGVDLAHYVLREVVPSLAPEDREALETLCALRAPAPHDLLARLDLDRPGTLARLQQANLVAEGGGGPEVHDLVRETLYEALPPASRRRIHGVLAEAHRPRGDAWGDVAEFLHHLTRAGRRDEAVRWLLRNRTRFLAETGTLFSRAAGPGSAA